MMKRSGLYKALILLLAFGATYSISYLIKLKEDSLAISNSFLALILLVLIFCLIDKGLTLADKHSFLFAGCYGLLFSAMLTFGTEVYTQGGVDYSLKALTHKAFLIVTFGSLLTALILLFIHKLPKIAHSLETTRLTKRWRQPSFFLMWLIIFLCWIPTFLTFYPGCYAYDMPNQVGQWVFGNFTTHHPLWHTLYLGIFVSLGEVLNNYTLAFALHTLSQMVFFSAMLAFTVWKLGKWKTPAALQLFSLLFFGLFPIHAVFSVSGTKDVLFSGFLLLVIVFTIDAVRDLDAFSKSIFCQIRFVLTVVLMCGFRNNGIYAFFVMIPFTLLFLKKHRIRMFSLCILSCILAVSATSLTARLLQAEKGSVAEMLSVPIQQFARIYTLRGEELEPALQEEICAFIDEEKIEQYNPFLADPVKDGFQAEYFHTHKSNFIKLWGKLLLKYPGNCLDAFFLTSLGNWYPDMNFPNMHPYMEVHIKETYIEGIEIVRDSKLPWLEPYYTLIAKETPHQKLPGISMFFSPGFYSWAMLFCIGYGLYTKKYTDALALLPLFGLWLTLLLSPISLMRYSYPFVLSFPVMLFTAIEKR